MEKVFKTKTGFCHILPDKIILSRDGKIGNVAKVTVGNNITRILFTYGLFIVALLFFTYDNYQKERFLLASFFMIIALIKTYGIFSSLNNSASPIIERKKIKNVILKKAIFGLTRARFEILFEDDKGKTKKRLIMLPGSFSDGKSETENARKIMKEENLLSK